jgi:D-alanine-D-alanine ligase
MKKHRVLALMHESMVPPENVTGVDLATVDWKMEYDVVATLENMGHHVRSIGVGSDLGAVRRAVTSFKPHIVFNLLEDFHNVAIYDQNVVSYLELLRVPYTGSNPRGLLLSRDKALTKKLLAYHRIPVPDFAVFRLGLVARRPKRLSFPLIVKSLVQDASAGISQASVVDDDRKLRERVAFIHGKLGTSAIAERYVDGRELYVGVLGNHRLRVLPIWEMKFSRLPHGIRPIATGRVKWSGQYQKKYGIRTAQAKDLPVATQKLIERLCKRTYRVLGLSGYARIDLRLDENGRVYVLEANANPQLAYGEDFAESAHHCGISYEQLLERIINLGRRYQSHRP